MSIYLTIASKILVPTWLPREFLVTYYLVMCVLLCYYLPGLVMIVMCKGFEAGWDCTKYLMGYVLYFVGGLWQQLWPEVERPPPEIITIVNNVTVEIYRSWEDDIPHLSYLSPYLTTQHICWLVWVGVAHACLYVATVIFAILCPVVKVLLYLFRQLENLFFGVKSRLGWKVYGYYLPESVRAGSTFHKLLKCPPFIGSVHGYHREVGWFRAGTCFRLGNFIYTAAHVLDNLQDVKLVVGDKMITVPLENFNRVGMDIALLPYDNNVCALGMTTAKPGNLSNVEVAATTDATKYSMGTIEHMEAVGYLSYTGSTENGFSGSPYYCGTVVYGMHVGASTTNLGVATPMLQVYARQPVDKCYKEESTAEWLQKIFRRNKQKIKFSRIPGGGDDVMVRTPAGIVVVDGDVFADLWDSLEDESEPRFEYVSPESFRPYEDSENFVQEQTQIPAVPASNLGITLPSLVIQDSPVEDQSTSQPKKTKSTTSSKASRSWGFTPRESTTAPSNVALLGTLNNFVLRPDVRKKLRAVMYSFQQLANLGILKQEQVAEYQEAWRSSWIGLNHQHLVLKSQAQQAGHS